MSQVIPLIVTVLFLSFTCAQLQQTPPPERPVSDSIHFYYEENLLFLSFTCAQLQQTPPPERPVSDSIHFYYEENLHYLVAAMISNCFLAPLTVTEDDHIHIHDGIEDAMLTMMRDWIGVLAETRIFHDDPNLPTDIKKWCDQRDIYLLERNLPAQTTPSSPLSG